MNNAELKKLLKGAEYEKVSYRPIRSRRYNVEVIKNGKVVETIPWISTMAKAKQIAAEYRTDGARCNIIEDVTFDNNYNEIKFIPKPYVDIPTGKMSFETAAMTPTRIALKKAMKPKPRPKLDNGKAYRISNPEHMPGTEMHKHYIDTVKRIGYTVKREGKIIFCGLQKECSEFLYQYFNENHLTLKDVEVIYNGA